MCGHEESMRTNPPARRWMSVSRSPITVAQEPSSRSLLNPSSLLLCHSIQSSVHPIPARARSVKSTALRSWSRESQVRRSRLGSEEFDGGAARPARRTLPHTHTGQRAPQFYNPQSKLLRFVNLGFDSFAVDVFNLAWTFLGFTQYRYFKLQKNQSTVVVPKSLPRLAKPEMSSLLNISICDAQTHSMSTQLNEAKLHFPVKKWVNGENWATLEVYCSICICGRPSDSSESCPTLIIIIIITRPLAGMA